LVSGSFSGTSEFSHHLCEKPSSKVLTAWIDDSLALSARVCNLGGSSPGDPSYYSGAERDTMWEGSSVTPIPAPDPLTLGKEQPHQKVRK
jgi:hypothetical protein